MTRKEELLAQLDAGWAGLQALRSRVEAGAPWPLSERFDNTPEAYWYPPEVLAHVAELLDRWLGVVSTIVDGGAEPVPFGQAGAHPARLAGIERNRRLPLPELYGLVETNLTAMRVRLAGLTDADLARRGIHPTRGETTVDEVVAGSVTGHLDEHVRQLATLLEAAGR